RRRGGREPRLRRAVASLRGPAPCGAGPRVPPGRPTRRRPWRKLAGPDTWQPRMTPTQRVLTGITTTGTPHLGNYVGAIRPAIAASRRQDVESFYFLADYHALVKCDDPARVARSRLEIAATWLALGLDTDRAHFYRQS